jgi:hypothetical protein
MSALGKPVTLAEWKAQHSTDIVEVFKPALSEPPNEKWCARATSVHVVDSDSKATRTLYFYEPSAPERPTIPKEDTTLLDQCRSGLASTTVDLPDSTRAASLLGKARQQIDAAIGAGQNNANVFWSGSASWTEKSLWQRDDVAVAAAIRSHGESSTPQVLVLGLGKSSGLRLDSIGPSDDDECHIRSRRTTARINEAIGIAALGESEAGLRAAGRMEAEECSRTTTPAEQSEIGDAIIRGLDSLRALPPGRRAAGLLAADQLLARSGLMTGEQDERPEIRQRLEARGAKFEWDHLGDIYVFTHDWLKESLRIDPEGRAGELAFLTLIEMGFNTHVGCSQGNDEFRVVIREGQNYLLRKPDSVLRSEIHLLMARAYGDVVALSEGATYDGDGREYRAEAPRARASALEEYRLWLESASSDPRRSERWTEAWRLAAGLSPIQTFFYCIYD